MGSRRVVVIVVAVIAMTSWLSVCGSGRSASVRPAAPNDGTITVGSFDFAESRLLAEIYSQAIEARGFHVRRAFDLGPARVRRPARSPTACRVRARVRRHRAAVREPRTRRAGRPTSRQPIDALVDALKARHVTALDSAPAQDANAFVVTRETRERYGLAPPQRPRRRRVAAHVRRTTGVRVAAAVPRRPGGRLRLEVQGVRLARRRRSVDPRGARRRRGRRGAACSPRIRRSTRPRPRRSSRTTAACSRPRT